MSEAVEDIIAERKRQIEVEGWHPDRDAHLYADGQLARAAASYAYEAGRTDHQRSVDNGWPPMMWPWSREWWKPTNRRRDLVKAAALIIADIERLDRISVSSPSSKEETP